MRLERARRARSVIRSSIRSLRSMKRSRIDDDPRDASGGDEAARVGDRDAEREPPALDAFERRFRASPPNRPEWARGARVAPRSRPTSCPGPSSPPSAFDARLFDQRDEPGRREHGHVAAADRERGVTLFDLQRDRRGETGREPHPLTIGSPAPTRHVGATHATMLEAHMTAPLIDHDVLQATLDHALRARWRLRRGVRRGSAVVERPLRRRPDRGARLRPRPRRGAAGRSRRHDRFRAHRRSLARRACCRRPRPRPARPGAVAAARTRSR